MKQTRTEENVIAVNEMVGLINHKGQKQTYRSIRQISKEKDLTKCSIVQIIHDIFVQKVYFVHQHACCLLLLVFHALIFHKVV